jgi:hypothetical protein
MAKEAPDRLSRGLAREELRNMRRAIGDSHVDGAAVVRFLELVRSHTLPRFAKGKRLTDAQCGMLKQEVSAFIDVNFRPIQKTQCPTSSIAGMAGDLDLNSFFYAQVNPQKLRGIDDESLVFDEEAMEFRCSRYFIDRRRAVLDDYSCNISFSDHTLMRMIQRKACEREPIAYLCSLFPSIIPYAPIYLSTAAASNRSFGLMIPMPDGVLMGVFTVIDDPDSIGVHYRRRIMSSANGSGFIPSPVPNIFPEDGNPQSMVAIRISTYISLNMMSDDQKWCRAALMAMVRQNQDAMPGLLGMMTTPEETNLEQVVPVYRDFGTIVATDFWRKANNLDESAATSLLY